MTQLSPPGGTEPGRGEAGARPPSLEPTSAGPRGAEAIPTDGASRRAAPAKLRILVVDDSADAADSLAKILTLWGHEVSVTYGGEDGLKRASDWHPGAALLDLGLPDLDGCSLAHRLRQQAPDGRMLVAAITGYADMEHRCRAAAAGFDVFLVKPVDLASLRELLAGWGAAIHQEDRS